MKKAKEYLEEYYSYQINEKKKSKNTVDAYHSDLNQFFLFDLKDLEEISKEDIERYIAHLLGNGLKPKTVNRKLVSIKQYIDYINNYKSKVKIFNDIDLIKIQKQEYLEEVLEKTDYERLVRMAEREEDKKAIAIFNTLYLTGVRVSELLQFKLTDAYSDTVSVMGKGKKYRDILIPDRLKLCLQEYIKSYKPKGVHLFANNEKPMTRQGIDKVIKKYAGMAKVKLSKAHAHNFRHLYALRLIEEGFTLQEVAELLGHADINTTKIYTRKTKKEMMKAIKSL